MVETLADDIAECRSLGAFHDLLVEQGIHRPGSRFAHLELDITNRCNLRCVMCYHSFDYVRQARTVHMTPEEFDAIAARVLPSAYKLTLSLGNEPLMSPHFIPILRAAAAYRVPEVNFFTNGLLLTDDSSDAIVESGVTQVCVSIDGATAGTYNAIRRNGDFDVLVRNLERLAARRDAAGSATPHLRFHFVMMQRNIHEIVDLVTLAARLGVTELNFSHLAAWDGLGMEGDSLVHTKALSNYWLEKALAAANALGIAVPFHPQPFDLGRETPPAALAADRPFLPTPYCAYPFFHVSIGPGGHLLACPFSHGEPPYGQLSAGVPFEEIWLGPRFTALRQRILRNDPPDMCRRCTFLSNHYPDTKSLFATRVQAERA
jgi:MoaA/NifB/PqqE/SkfB family radical SAM enzyme